MVGNNLDFEKPIDALELKIKGLENSVDIDPEEHKQHHDQTQVTSTCRLKGLCNGARQA